MNLVIKSELPWPMVEERLGWAKLEQERRDATNILKQAPDYQYQTISSYHCDCGTLIGQSRAPTDGEKRDQVVQELDYWIGGLTRLLANPKIERVGVFHFFGDDDTLEQLELNVQGPICLSELSEQVLRGLEEHSVLQVQFDRPPADYSLLGERLSPLG